MEIILKENSEEIRQKLIDAGLDVCACAYFKNSCWLDCHPGISDRIHGVGYFDGDELGIKSQEDELKRYVSELRQPVWCKDVDEFIDRVKHTYGIWGGYVVRNKDGELVFFSRKPERDEESGCWLVYGGACITMDMGFENSFPDQTWESEPTQVELIMRKL